MNQFIRYIFASTVAFVVIFAGCGRNATDETAYTQDDLTADHSEVIELADPQIESAPPKPPKMDPIVEPNKPAAVNIPPVPQIDQPNTIDTEKMGAAQPEISAPNVPDVNIKEPNTPYHAATEANTPSPAGLPETLVQAYEQYHNLLKEYVDTEGQVDYDTLKRKRIELNRTVDVITQIKADTYASLGEKEKLAYWINIYNIQTLKILVDNYPIESAAILRVIWGPDSIRHIDKKIGGIHRQKFIIMDEEFTLKAIEDRFLRNQPDARVFMAICMGTVSSPPLQNEPYTGEKLDKQLNKQIRRFIDQDNAITIDQENWTVRLSAMYRETWFGNEFIPRYGTKKKFKEHQPHERAVLNFLTEYVDPKTKSFLEVERYLVRYKDFDWRLNQR